MSSARLSDKPLEVLLVDDHPVVRRGLIDLIGCEIACRCTEAASHAECLAALSANDFDLAVLDISLGQESGLGLVAALAERHIGIIVYSMFEDAETIRRALADGCLGYVSKREPADEVLAGIRDALAGQVHLSPIAACAIDGAAEGGDGTLLSLRESEVLDLLGKGYRRQEIAVALAVSARTVETYGRRIIGKLNLSGTREPRRHAIERKLRPPVDK